MAPSLIQLVSILAKKLCFNNTLKLVLVSMLLVLYSF